MNMSNLLRLPIYSCLIICFVAFLSIITPEETYEMSLGEPSFISYNFLFLLLVLTSTFFFVVSYTLSLRIKWFYDIKAIKDIDEASGSSGAVAFSLLLAIALSLVSIFSVTQLISLPKIFAILAGGDEVVMLRKEIAEQISMSSVGWVLPFVLGIITLSLCTILTTNSTKNIKYLLLISIVFFILASFITLTRASIFKLFLLIIIVFLITGRLSLKSVFSLKSTAIIISLFLFFVFIQAARQSEYVDSYGYVSLVYKTFFGYFGASFNRAGAILYEDYYLPGSGFFYYSLNFLWNYPLIPDLLGIKDIALYFDESFPVNSLEAVKTNFYYLSSSSLSLTYNWPSIYGVAISEFGYLFPIYFLILGAVYGLVFRACCIFRTPFYFALCAYLINSVLWWFAGINSYDRYFGIFFTAIFIFSFIQRVKLKSVK